MLKEWARILSAYFSTQTLIQLAGIAAGLLFINFMPVQEFALYTLAFSVITFFTFASDLGSGTSLLYFYQQTTREGGEFRPYHEAVLSLRRAVFLLGAVVVALAFPRAAAAEGFGLRESLLVTGGIVLCVWFQINASLRLLALRLADRYGRSYRAELAGGGVRLGLAAAMVAAGLLWSWLGVLAAAAATATVALLARPVSSERTAPATADLGPYRKRILRYLLPTLPGALYFSLQAPLLVWLSATFGATRNIAEVGALSRLGLVVGLLSGLTGTVFLPRLARIVDDRHYRLRSLQFGALLAAAGAALVLAAALVPRAFLFLLGESYAGLDGELVLVVAASALALLDGYVVSINLARSWTRWQGAALGVQVAIQAGLIALLPLSTTWNVLLFNLASAGSALLLQTLIALAGFTRPHWVYWT